MTSRQGGAFYSIEKNKIMMEGDVKIEVIGWQF